MPSLKPLSCASMLMNWLLTYWPPIFAIEAEVSEARLAADTANVGKEVIKDAIKQAVDQAVLKLSMPKSAPVNESRKKKKG